MANEERMRWLATALLLAMGIGGLIDLILDWPSTIWSGHVLFEIGLLGLSLGGVALLWLGWRDTGRALDATRTELDARIRDRDAWRGRAETLLRGLGEAIESQLVEWSLTPVERETALLLLKGFGHKEIAAIQEKSERTVRQHAVAIYRKSGLAGRAELSAFFLEDLLLPTTLTTSVTTSDSPATEEADQGSASEDWIGPAATTGDNQ